MWSRFWRRYPVCIILSEVPKEGSRICRKSEVGICTFCRNSGGRTSSQVGEISGWTSDDTTQGIYTTDGTPEEQSTEWVERLGERRGTRHHWKRQPYNLCAGKYWERLSNKSSKTGMTDAHFSWRKYDRYRSSEWSIILIYQYTSILAKRMRVMKVIFCPEDSSSNLVVI